MTNILRKLKRIVTGTIQAFKSEKYIPIINTCDTNLLNGKVTLITGGSGGIGSSIANTFVKSGGHVIIAGTNKIKLQKITSELSDEAAYVIIDLRSMESIVSGVEQAINCWGRIDILVNAAGIHSQKVFNNFLEVDEKDYDSILDINLKGIYFVTQTVAKYMVKNHIRGHILNISSSTATEPAWSPYRLSKWGIRGLTLGFAQQLQKYGIIVNAIAPGSTATNLLGFKEGDSIYSKDNNNHRLILPSEIAQYAKMMVSDLGNMIVGDTLYISGGRGVVNIK